MRVLHCPICASSIQQRGGLFDCMGARGGGRFSSQLGNSIRRAVYGVDEAKTPPRQPEIAPYLWCPNCTGELEEYDVNTRRLECKACGLKLPATDQQELLEVRQHHGKLEDDQW